MANRRNLPEVIAELRQKLERVIAAHDEVHFDLLAGTMAVDELLEDVRAELPPERLARLDAELNRLTAGVLDVGIRHKILLGAHLALQALDGDVAGGELPAGGQRLALMVNRHEPARPSPRRLQITVGSTSGPVVPTHRVFHEQVEIGATAGIVVGSGTSAGSPSPSRALGMTVVDSVQVTDAVFVQIVKAPTDPSSGTP